MLRPIAPIEYEQLEPRLAEQLRSRVERLGYLGDFFRYTAHQPDALRLFAAFTEAARGGIAVNLAEVVALTVATRLDNRYELVQHERHSRRLGMSGPWIAAVERVAPDHESELCKHERATQRYVLAAVATLGAGAAQELQELVTTAGERTAVGVMFVTARYVAHSVIAMSLELEPPFAGSSIR